MVVYKIWQTQNEKIKCIKKYDYKSTSAQKIIFNPYIFFISLFLFGWQQPYIIKLRTLQYISLNGLNLITNQNQRPFYGKNRTVNFTRTLKSSQTSN